MTDSNPERLFRDWFGCTWPTTADGRGYRHLYRPSNFHGRVAAAVGEYRLARALMVVAEDGRRLRAWPDPRRGDEKALADPLDEDDEDLADFADEGDLDDEED